MSDARHHFSRPNRRMTLVDGLRGVAAMGVVCVHAGGLLSVAKDAPGAAVIPLVEPYRELAGVGVDVFFVLSGFVIAHSVGRSRVGAGYFGRFVLRRSIRLDVPYFASIALAVGLLSFRGRLGNEQVDWPTGGQVAAHLPYLQKFFGYDHLMVIYWTLCLEVQFYLAFVLLLWATHAAAERLALDLHSTAVAIVSAGFVVSLAWPVGAFEIPHHLENVWFLPHWHKFLIGAVVAYAAAGRLRVSTALIAVIVLAVAVTARCLIGVPTTSILIAGLIAGPATAGLLLLAVRRQALYRWLDWRPLLFVGGVSYSVYLIHIPVVTVLLGAQKRLVATSEPMVIAFFIASLALSVAAAWVMFQLVERPALRLAKRVRLSSGPRQGATNTRRRHRGTRTRRRCDRGLTRRRSRQLRVRSEPCAH